MNATRLLARFPRPIRRWALHFECSIEDALSAFARALPPRSLVLDAGAGEGRHRPFFDGHHYIGVDLAVGDAAWDYSRLDSVADLNALPFPSAAFDAALNIVTLEHLTDPGRAIAEISRVLKPGGRLFLAAPLEWEEHQQPHDYFRYTRYGLTLLLDRAGFTVEVMSPAGGYFRLLSRRLLNGLQFFMRGPAWILFIPAAAFLVPLSLLAPLFEPLDTERNFTLGYICTARKLP